jgi:hypothetical protein
MFAIRVEVAEYAFSAPDLSAEPRKKATDFMSGRPPVPDNPIEGLATPPAIHTNDREG